MIDNRQTEHQDYYNVTKTRSLLRQDISPLVMKITTQSGMVNMNNDDISYSDIRNMYTTGKGYGLQLSKRFKHKRSLIIDICSDIADKIYELQDVLSE